MRRERVVLHLPRNRGKKEFGKDTGEAERGSGFPQSTVENMQNKRGFEVEER